MRDDQPTEPQPEQEGKEDKRKRAIAWIARIRARVQRFCGMVKETNGLIAEAQDAAEDIRELLRDPSLHSVLPVNARSLLGTAALRLERVESLLDRTADVASVPADICAQTLEALDIADSLLQGKPPWKKLWDAAGGAKALAGVATAIAVALLAIVLANGDDPPIVSGISILSAPASMTVGDEADITVQIEDANGTPITEGVTLEWTSGDSGIVDVSPSGRAVAIAEGRTEVIASVGDLRDSVVIAVAAPAPEFLPDLTLSFPDPPTVDCIQGSCTLMVDVLVSNVDRGAAEPTVLLLSTSNGQTGSTRVPALEGGRQTTVRVVTDPGTNCYSPDCTLTGVVDEDDLIDESDEGNNRVVQLFGG